MDPLTEFMPFPDHKLKVSNLIKGAELLQRRSLIEFWITLPTQGAYILQMRSMHLVILMDLQSTSNLIELVQAL